MSGSKKKRPPLVAERPGGKSRAQAKPARGAGTSKSTKNRSQTKSRSGSARGGRGRGSPPPKGRGGISGFFRRIVGWVFYLVWSITWRTTAVVGLIVGMAVFYYHSTLPPVAELLDARTRGSVTMLDRNGDVFAWRGEQFGGQVTASGVAPVLKHAVLATEDKRFYWHFGISPRGVASAVRINLREGRGPLSGHGGSTITQQTAKLLCIGISYDPDRWDSEAAYEDDCREGSLWRKMKEAVYALAMEVKYSKDEILTIYLNRAYLGAGARGFEAAAQRYFGKSAAQVDAAEAAMLAGLLTAPSRYAPTNNIQRSRDRAAVVVKLMEGQRYLTEAQAQEAIDNPAELSAAAEARAGGYLADWVMDRGPAFLMRDTFADVVIRTTFDQRIQRATEDALSLVFDEEVREGSKAQAAIVVMSADGAVRAMVGGRKFKGVAGQFNRAIMAKRQTGSAFKPFVYATALELGHSYRDRVMDSPLTINVRGSGPWSPKNYTKEYRGEVTLTEALAHSLNIPAVRVAQSVGLDKVRHVASEFGIASDLALGPALALGASESTLLEMTGAYAGILNGGSSVRPYGMTELKLVGDEAPLMGQTGGIGERVISEQAAKQLIYMMSRVMTDGTGRRAALPDREAAGKTGTTQAARDAWFLGFTADYVVGVWMGYDNNTPLTGVTGGGLPAEIWREVMLGIHEELPPRPLPMIRPGAPAPAAVPRAVEPPRAPAPAQNTAPRANVADRILQDVLGNIAGGQSN